MTALLHNRSNIKKRQRMHGAFYVRKIE